MEFIGAIGAALILLAFIGNELSWWNKRSLSFDSINALGAVVLMYYSWQLGSWPFLALNTVWLVFALKDIIRRFI